MTPPADPKARPPTAPPTAAPMKVPIAWFDGPPLSLVVQAVTRPRAATTPTTRFTLDLAGADVVMLYLSPELNERLLSQLARLKPGSRIVSHAFEIPGVPPDRVVTVPSAEDDLDHKVYVWTTPLKKGPAPK